MAPSGREFSPALLYFSLSSSYALDDLKIMEFAFRVSRFSGQL